MLKSTKVAQIRHHFSFYFFWLNTRRLYNKNVEIVVEFALVDNLIINFLILYLSAMILKIKTNKLLVSISASLGAICSIISPILNLPLWLSVVYKVLLGLIMARIGLSPTGFKQNIIGFGAFLLMTGAVGGICFGIVFLFSGEITNSGIKIFGWEIPVSAVLTAVCLICLLISKFIKHINRKKLINTFIFNAEIVNENKKTEFEVYLDSGNNLVDPITKKPVIIVDFSIFKKIVDVPFDKVITKKIDEKDIENSRYIDYGTVGGNGKMLVFEVKEFLLDYDAKNKKIFKNAVVGLSFSPLKKSFDCGALIGPEFAKEFVL